MDLEENTKAIVRQFLASAVAQQWLIYCEKSCRALDLDKHPLESYNASLIRQAHWREAIEFARTCVEETPPIPDYGRPPIDNTQD